MLNLGVGEHCAVVRSGVHRPPTHGRGAIQSGRMRGRTSMHGTAADDCIDERRGGGGAPTGGAGRRPPARPRRQRLRRGGGHGCSAQRGRALHVGAGRAGARDLLGGGGAAHQGARFRAARAAALSRRALQDARGAGPRAPLGRRAGQSRRLGRAGPRARQEDARRCAPAGDRPGPGRLPARRVQRRGDERARARPEALHGLPRRVRPHLHGRRRSGGAGPRARAAGVGAARSSASPPMGRRSSTAERSGEPSSRTSRRWAAA